jgi:molybdopterin-guanine dinucleotide biosynthesis protein A
MSGVTSTALGAVLIGGASRRMGADKPRLEVAGSTMFAKVATALEAAGCEVLGIGRQDTALGWPTIADDGPGGPAAGLATALRVAAGRPVFLAAADQPRLRSRTVSALLGIEGDAIVPVDKGIRQVTCAVYRLECAEPLAGLLTAGPTPSLRDLLDRVDAVEVGPDEWSAWEEDGRSWWSIDTPQDLEALRRELGK